MSDPEQIIDDLYALRDKFGSVGDDYRQARIDVAIEQLMECKDVQEDYEAAGVWGDENTIGPPLQTDE